MRIDEALKYGIGTTKEWMKPSDDEGYPLAVIVGEIDKLPVPYLSDGDCPHGENIGWKDLPVPEERLGYLLYKRLRASPVPPSQDVEAPATPAE